MADRAAILEELSRRPLTPRQQALVEELRRRNAGGPAAGAPPPTAPQGQVDVLSMGPPGTAAAQGAVPEPEPGVMTIGGPTQGLPPAVAQSATILSRLGLVSRTPLVAGQRPTPSQRVQQRAAQGGLGATVGELGGQAVGSALMPGVGTAVGGAVGAGLGEAAEELVRGQPLNPRRIGLEVALSAAPELAESTVRGVGRQVLRRLPGGQRIRFDEAVRQARQLVGDVFQPQTRQQVGAAFDLVRQSGLRVDVDDIAKEVGRLTPGKFADLVSEVQRLDTVYKTGGRYTQLVTNLRTPGAVRIAGYDIGDLQQLSSGLRERGRALGTHEARVLLDDLRTSVDDAIFTGLARGRVPRGQVPEVLQEARAQWARVRAAEDLQQLVEVAINSTPDLAMNSFNLRQLVDGLRKGQTEATRAVRRAIDLTPGARQAFLTGLEQLAKQYKTIEFPLTGVTGLRRFALVDFAAQMLSSIVLSEKGQDIFRQTVLAGRGTTSLNAIALAGGIARRELGLPPLAIPGAPVPGQGSGMPGSQTATTPGG